MKYIVGPFEIDSESKKVTLHPGKYTITEPITLGILGETVVTGVSYAPRRGSEVTSCP